MRTSTTSKRFAWLTLSFALCSAACAGMAPSDTDGDGGSVPPGADGATAAPDGATTPTDGAAAPDGATTSTDGSTATTIDPTHLPISDDAYSTTTPAVGMVYRCTGPNTMGGGAMTKGPWFNADGTTWNSLTKLVVSGAVSWASSFSATVSGTTLQATGNGLPNHPTGTFPIPKSDPISAYDGNPNSIKTANLSWALVANPTVAAKPSCLPNGPIGVMLTGVRLYNATDELARDAVAWEGQDSCQGHPQQQGQYHYHSLSTCAVTDTPGEHSPLVGYAADGFGIFGNQGEGGVALTNADLDECHGHTHAVSIRGQLVTQYHYHATKEYPYTLGCFKGTPATVH